MGVTYHFPEEGILNRCGYHTHSDKLSLHITSLTVLLFFFMLKIPSFPLPPLLGVWVGMGAERVGGRVLGTAGLDTLGVKPPTFLETAMKIQNSE